jgi:hypothetical protein
MASWGCDLPRAGIDGIKPDHDEGSGDDGMSIIALDKLLTSTSLINNSSQALSAS